MFFSFSVYYADHYKCGVPTVLICKFYFETYRDTIFIECIYIPPNPLAQLIFHVFFFFFFLLYLIFPCPIPKV